MWISVVRPSRGCWGWRGNRFIRAVQAGPQCTWRTTCQ
uniref:Uncharacterized protein n=1 Tax=Anguilla anguilla TaxID=7936 RepID=A0A0E9UX71_ANGAN